jgi:microcystin degradation protein MlrC
MSFRFAVGGISHETNNYCKEPTRLSAFNQLRGQEMIRRHRGVRSYIGGMIDAADALGARLIPVYHAQTQPSGTILADAYALMLDELLEGIRKSLPVDAVALPLHGAGVVEGIDDLEGHLVRAVRDLVGPDVKIVVTLDLHGNITQAMADSADMCFGVHFYPHTDSYERGQEAVMAIPKLLSGEWKPVTHVESIPMVLTASTTNHYPSSAVNEVCWDIERRPGVLDCTFFHGFPYADTPVVGASVLAMANDDYAKARSAAKEAARWIWDHREDFRREMLTPAQAIDRALEVDGRPVVINETADNPGAGAPGDATHVLRAMLDRGLNEACFAFMYDPGVAEQAHRSGVGSTIRVSLGGKSDPDLHGAPLDVTAYVKCLTDGRFIQQSPMGRGGQVDLGRMARLQVGGVDVLVSSVRTQVLDPEVFLLHGIDVTRYKVVVVKSSGHFRAGFQPLAKAIITADSPGLSTLDVRNLVRVRTRVPSWPLDPDTVY